MEIQVLNKNVRVQKQKGLIFQIWLHCFLNNISISTTDMDILIRLINCGKCNLRDFCVNQSERNSVNRLSKMGLIVKTRKYNKTIEFTSNVPLLNQSLYCISLKLVVHDKEG